MSFFFDAFLLGLGLILVVQSAKVFVKASVGLAQLLRIPTMIIGLTVVAMGTSAPEVVVSVTAAIGSSGDLAVANAVGSNIFNLLFIVGLCAAIYPVSVNMKAVSRDYWVSVGATIVLLLMVVMFGDTLPRFASIILLGGFVVYMAAIVFHTLKITGEDPAKHEAETEAENECVCEGECSCGNPEEAQEISLVRCIVMLVIGIVSIVFGGHLVVTNAVDLAQALGISERVIGLTVVAMGTSLPEVVTTLVACRKGEGDFALGFIIGSSIFNIMFVLGLAGTITPLGVDPGVVYDMLVLTVGTLGFYILAVSGKRLVRAEGIFMVACFLAYMTWVIV